MIEAWTTRRPQPWSPLDFKQPRPQRLVKAAGLGERVQLPNLPFLMKPRLPAELSEVWWEQELGVFGRKFATPHHIEQSQPIRFMTRGPESPALGVCQFPYPQGGFQQALVHFLGLEAGILPKRGRHTRAG